MKSHRQNLSMLGLENDNSPLIAGDSASEKPASKLPGKSRKIADGTEFGSIPLTAVKETNAEYKSESNVGNATAADETYYVENKTNKLIDFNAQL